MTEIKSYGRPPPLVEKVMVAVMVLRLSEPTWAEAKKQLGSVTCLSVIFASCSGTPHEKMTIPHPPPQIVTKLFERVEGFINV